MHLRFQVLLPVILISLLSCGNAEKKNESSSPVTTSTATATSANANDSFQPGTVIKSVACQSVPDQSYALYLPKKFSWQHKYPVVFFFDAHARGSLPVSKYADLADRYGFILVCSNDSRNSLDAGMIINITSNFLNDVTKRFPVDMLNIFAGGFSGGSRVAIGITLQDNRIKGVIANSAGFQPAREPLAKDVCFVGLVGNEDFNLSEMKNTQVSLNEAGIVNDLLIFNGKHDWAPASDMDKAFLLLTLEGVRAKRMERNDSIIDASFNSDEKEAEKLLRGNANVLTKYAACHLMNLYYAGIKPVDKYARLEKSISGPDYQEARHHEKQEAAAEQAEQQRYAMAFQEKDMTWWMNEINRLNAEASSTKNKDRAQYDKRLLAYLSLASFMSTNSALKQDALPQAEIFLTLYKMVDPTNSEWAYLSAFVCMKKNDVSGALSNLDKAVELGFNDLYRIRSQREFEPLQNDQKFNEIIAKIKQD